MNFFSPFTGSGVAAGSTERADLMAKLQANNAAMARAEKERIQYLRDEEARRREMEAVPSPEALPSAAPAPMVAGMPAPAPTFATTPVPDAQRNQYIARNVTPQVAPNQSDAESKRLASKAPPKPGVLEQVAAVTTMPGALAVGPGQYMSDADRFAELKRLNPSATTGGNESMAEANRLLSKGASATTAAPAAPANFDALAQAVKMVESGGDPNAVSPKGAVGTMQTMPGTLRDPGYGVRPAQNNTPAELERVGRDYLQAMIAKYPGRLDHALAAYNWGPGNTDKWIAAGADPAKLPQETRDYIPKVLGRLVPGEAAPTQTATAVPTQPAPATAAAPAAPTQGFTPEQVTRLAAESQQELRMAQLQLAEINRRLQYAPTLAAATKLRDAANQIRFNAFGAQIKNAAAFAAGGDERAMAQLANAAGVQYAQTPQGYVAVQLGSDGQYRATTQPMPREQFINTLYSEASGAAAKLRATQQEADIEAQKQIAIERVKAEGKVYENQAAAQRDLQKLIAERRLTENDIKGLEFDPVKGTLYKRTNTGVEVLVPGQPLGGGMMSQPRFVPI